MAIEYSKTDDGKIEITRTVTEVQSEAFSVKELTLRLNQLVSDRDAFIAKMQIEIDSWNQAIAEVESHIVEASKLGLK